MIQRVVQSSGLDLFAQIGLIAFIIAFVLVLIWVFLIDSEEAQRHADIPLSDDRKPTASSKDRDEATQQDTNRDGTHDEEDQT